MKQRLQTILALPSGTRGLFLFCFFVAGLILGALPWNWIQLPFHPSTGMGEISTRLGQNPANQLVRFAVFVFTPSALLGLLFFWVRPPQARPASAAQIGVPGWIARLGAGFLVAFPAWALAAYFSRTLGPRYFDLLHHGEQMTPAWNHLFKGGFWSTSYFLHGVFFDLLIGLSGWSFWGVRSFGAYELADALMWVLVPSALCFFVFALGRAAAADRLTRAVLAQVVLGVFLLAGVRFHYSPHRYIPVYLGFGFYLWAQARASRPLYFGAGLMLPACFAYSIDMGAYYGAALTGLCALSAWVDFGRFRSQWVLPSVGAGVLFGALVFVGVFGWAETQAFVHSTLSQIKYKDVLNGMTMRSPLEKGGGYSRANMTVIAAVLFATTWSLFTQRSRREQFLPLFFAGASLLFFRSALGRSDVGHIQYASSFAYLALGYWLWRRWGDSLARRASVAIPLLLLANTALGIRAVGWVHPSAMISFASRARDYVEMPDAYFLQERTVEIEALKEVFFPEPCLFSLTLDAGMGYLLKKTTCNRFYIPWFASPKPLREELLADLIAKQPRVILVESRWGEQDVDGISNRERFAELYAYIDTHYLPVERVEGWGIRRLRR